MPFVSRKTVVTFAVLSGIGVLGAAGFVWSGTYDVGADTPHWRPTYAVLETLRERSIEARAASLQVPADLASPTRIQQGAGNYAAMCAGCHLAPGIAETEMSKGLYPAPPNLTKQTVDAAGAFWVIKHGVKASGMPAWGKNMQDDYIWNMAAFLQVLPKLDAAQYRALVAGSEGHSHGGGETAPHAHPAGMGEDHDDADGDHHSDANAPKPHAHPPGTPPHEDAPAPQPKEPDVPEPHDEHEHAH